MKQKLICFGISGMKIQKNCCKNYALLQQKSHNHKTKIFPTSQPKNKILEAVQSNESEI